MSETFVSDDGYEKFGKAKWVTRVGGNPFERIKGTKGWGYNTRVNIPFMVNVVDDYEMFKELAKAKPGHTVNFILGKPAPPKPKVETKPKTKIKRGDKK